jgi:endonuclease YncB( thermonuclease family)
VVLLLLAALATLAVEGRGRLAPEHGSFTAIDGDSLRKGEQEYRLHGIDAPELSQSCRRAGGTEYPCGRAARDHLRSLVSHATLDCAVRETDRYGRLVTDCRAGEVDINRDMVASGWAIAYRRHGTSHTRSEADAKAARRGIWQGDFETPEDWRKRHRNAITRGGMSEVPVPDD